MNTKQKILEGAIDVFNQKGLKFTMDDLAKHMGMSKKTLYVVFKDKQTLFFEMVDYLFDSIKESQEEVLNRDDISTVEKLQKIMGVLPESYQRIDFQKLYLLKDKYPKTYLKVEQHLETGWETTISLLNQGMEEGTLRKTNIFLVKMMFESSLEQFFQRNILSQSGLTYHEALKEVVNIIMNGIVGKVG